MENNFEIKWRLNVSTSICSGNDTRNGQERVNSFFGIGVHLETVTESKSEIRSPESLTGHELL